MRLQIIRIGLVLLMLTGLSQKGIGQMKDSIQIAETSAEVPALSEFHNIIYPLWHTAWPEKNIGMLVELLPEIEKRSADVLNAKLPGILREKQDPWSEKIKELKGIVEEYRAAATPVDSQKLLSAAERLHTVYEKLVRTIRPAVKELDAFHSVLYMLYHYYLPEWKLEKIKTSVAELKVKMELLNQAQISKLQELKKEAFAAALAKLDAAVKELEPAVTGGEKKVISEKIEAMHMQYQAVDTVFK